MSENVAFTERAVAKAQKLSIDDPFCAAITEYLIRHDRLAYDLGHKLWWVTLPNGAPQVAVWMMPVCEPLKEDERASIAVSQIAKVVGA